MATPMIAAMTAIVPPVLAVMGKFVLASREPARLKRMKRHLDLVERMPGDAKEHMERLLAAEAKSYADDRIFRMRRKLDGFSLSLLIVLGALIAGVIVLGFALAVKWGWWVHFVTGTVALFGLLLMLIGVGTVWTEKSEPKPVK